MTAERNAPPYGPRDQHAENRRRFRAADGASTCSDSTSESTRDTPGGPARRTVSNHSPATACHIRIAADGLAEPAERRSISRPHSLVRLGAP
ncbi:hypothetical protein FHR81_000064 [Actinoalloteichus hoggarensis]|uniref:Uncharacterized protein n=1 Tax=Actinoalloteichus hoggarensis TaxID=1470176 RepID=A0A221W3N3_9PSEU|nr:hypothetical protein AHOG_13040 [Actinoalloteichus hoggarensis]MBB5919035.1 hypothetical protein [Actinoalloteichus hoggarensis]